jgi:hypothetical protein
MDGLIIFFILLTIVIVIGLIWYFVSTELNRIIGEM